jgi:hypothetical protein
MTAELHVDEVIVGVSEECRALVSSAPLGRRIGWRDELRDDVAGGAPRRIIQRRQIVFDRTAGALQIAVLVPVLTHNRPLLVGVGRNQARVDCKTFAADWESNMPSPIWAGRSSGRSRRFSNGPRSMRLSLERPRPHFWRQTIARSMMSTPSSSSLSTCLRAGPGSGVAKAVGRRVPQNIFEVRLPASWPANTTALAGPSIGMTIDDVRKLFGGVKLRVDYVLNGQSASRMIIETRAKGSFVAFTFVDDRLIAFEDLGSLPDEVLRAF